MRWWLVLLGLVGGACFGGDRHVGVVTGGAVDGEVVWSVSRGGLYVGEGEGLRLVLRPDFRVMDVAVTGEREVIVGGGIPGEKGVVGVVRGGELAETWEVGSDLVYAVAATEGGEWTGVACADGRIRVGRGVGAWEVMHEHTGTGTSVAFSGDGKRLASGGLDGVVMVSNVGVPGRERVVIDDHTAGVTCVVFSPDGKLVASGARDSRVRLHTVEGRLVRTYSGLGMEDEAVAGRVESRVLSLDWGEGGLRAGTSKGWIYRLADGDEGWVKVGGEAGVPVWALRPR